MFYLLLSRCGNKSPFRGGFALQLRPECQALSVCPLERRIMRKRLPLVPLFTCAVAVLTGWQAPAATVQVTIRNLAPINGSFLTPVWTGFHDGSFDLYNSGSPASSALERLAEDGDTSFLTALFSMSGAGTQQGTLMGPMGPIAPGQTATMSFNLNPLAMSSRYFSYASMVIPSNDAFIANGNPMALPVFNSMGQFLGGSFTVLGSMVLDAGTELNDEVPMNTAFFGQMAPNTGVTTNGVVMPHPGFIPGGANPVVGHVRQCRLHGRRIPGSGNHCFVSSRACHSRSDGDASSSAACATPIPPASALSS